RHPVARTIKNPARSARPGTYSLSPYSPDERIARDFLLFERPDVVCVVVDALSLERNLYFVAQLVELDIPIVLALNMMDIAKSRKIEIDIEELSILVGAPVVPTVGSAGKGIPELLKKIVEVAGSDYSPVPLNYGKESERAISEVEGVISRAPMLARKCHIGRFLAAMLLAGDPEIENLIFKNAPDGDVIKAKIEAIRHRVEARERVDGETILADARNGWASGVYHEVVKDPHHDEPTATDKIDDVLLHGFFGPFIFAAIMFAIFWTTFRLGAFPVAWIEGFFGWLGGIMGIALDGLGASAIVKSLVIDGIIGGVGGVLAFLPNIIILFFFVAILEDSGYMSRAAFLVDKLMHRIGLHGKSFIPIILGFGCTVPAIMATRTLENRQDRLLTILILPFVMCSARIPIFVLISGAFFPNHAGLVMFSMYALSIAVAMLTARILKSIMFPGLSTPFVMELPPYHLPTGRGVAIHTWERSWLFVRKAGTIILAGSVLIWALGSLPPGVQYAGDGSWAASIGKFFAPIVGTFGVDWRGAVALLFGFAAKEIVVATLFVLIGTGNASINVGLAHMFTPLSAYAFMVFTLIYTPCIATVAAIKKETGGWKWPAFSVLLGLIVAWILATAVFQIGKIAGLQG
ncbi:ferrous iron transport protein B, partial [bacterium]|nr:ferrous iron transport protein B [bacterium]